LWNTKTGDLPINIEKIDFTTKFFYKPNYKPLFINTKKSKNKKNRLQY